MKRLIQNFADIISELIYYSNDDPLNGDETERLGRLFTLELDLRQGNITMEEYEEEIRKLEYNV